MKTHFRSKEMLPVLHQEVMNRLVGGMSVGQIARALRLNEIHVRDYVKKHSEMQSLAQVNAKRRQMAWKTAAPSQQAIALNGGEGHSN